MPDTIVLMFHPSPATSRVNAALAAAAATLDDVAVVDMQALYPDGAIDAEAEVARLLGARRLVLQFPLQWYSVPPLLKAWQDQVLTRMYYIRPREEGDQLVGTPLLVASTAGNTAAAYTPGGANLFPLAELMQPLQATANRCGLPFAAPFFVYEAGRLDDAALADAGRAYAARIESWRRAVPGRADALPAIAAPALLAAGAA